MTPKKRNEIHKKAAEWYLASLGDKGIALNHACGKSAIEVVMMMNKEIIDKVIELVEG